MKIFHKQSRKRNRALLPRIDRSLRLINQASNDLEATSDEELQHNYQALCHHYQFESFSVGQVDDQTLISTFAITKEALRRTAGMAAYDVQLRAGLAMATGAIAEMQTGEGKTLTSMFPITAFALFGKGVHVATVNDYLAQRDFEFLLPALEMLGLSAGISNSDKSPDEKRTAYASDVTFATGYELGFDFLRDQMAMRNQSSDRLGAKLRQQLAGNTARPSTQTQRGFAAAIVDEIDSVFIDEATTPLVLSSGSIGDKIDKSVYDGAKLAAEQLEEHTDFVLDESEKTLSLTNQGIEFAHQLRDSMVYIGLQDQLLRPWRSYIESALRAKHLMIRDINYVIRDDAVEIVDEYTGRIFSDRNWRDGLHQAVEAKEEVKITEERKTVARISRQRYFQRYEVLCGMTGTADGHQQEMKKVYQLPIVIIPRRNNLRREELFTRYFNSFENKTTAVVLDVKQRHSNGQPILIGTRTIEQSWAISKKLDTSDIPHKILNGVQDEEEASLIESAGTHGSVMVATNMAGRGTDIKPDLNALDVGGLHVIGLERNSSIRIDRQLLGRAGRQGDPGSGQFFVSAEDEIITRFDQGFVRLLKRITDPDGSAGRTYDRRVMRIQQAAEKAGLESRESVMREELWMDKVKKTAG